VDDGAGPGEGAEDSERGPPPQVSTAASGVRELDSQSQALTLTRMLYDMEKHHDVVVARQKGLLSSSVIVACPCERNAQEQDES